MPTVYAVLTAIPGPLQSSLIKDKRDRLAASHLIDTEVQFSVLRNIIACPRKKYVMVVYLHLLRIKVGSERSCCDIHCSRRPLVGVCSPEQLLPIQPGGNEFKSLGNLTSRIPTHDLTNSVDAQSW